jgi:hypothetical protein
MFSHRIEGLPKHILSGKQRLERALSMIGGLPSVAVRLLPAPFRGVSCVAVAREMSISPSMVEKHIAETMLRLVCGMNGSDGHP